MIKLPDSITIRIYPAPGSKDTWLVEIPEILQFTQGYSVSDAAQSAMEVLKLLSDECVSPLVSHCWCRETSIGEHDDYGLAYGCCRCDAIKRKE